MREHNKDTIFMNADYIVIEYIDLIKSPYYMLLSLIKNNMRIREILKIETIDFLNDRGLYEWYVNRKHQNFFIDLNRYPNEITNDQLDKLLNDQLSVSDVMYTKSEPLQMLRSVATMLKEKMAKGVIVYHPHSNPFAKNDLDKLLGRDVVVIDDFDKVMHMAGSNSTYFLSDINKINIMKEKGVLKLSSISLPIEYMYNKNNPKEFKLDFKEIYKEQPFKLTYFTACSTMRIKGE